MTSAAPAIVGTWFITVLPADTTFEIGFVLGDAGRPVGIAHVRETATIDASDTYHGVTTHRRSRRSEGERDLLRRVAWEVRRQLRDAPQAAVIAAFET